MAGYDLPELNVIDHKVLGEFGKKVRGLFPSIPRPLGISELRSLRRESLSARVGECSDLVNDSDECWVVWCDLNDESSALVKAIPDAVEVRGSDRLDKKIQSLVDFSNGKIRVLVTKPSIAGHGLNWQHCARMAFVGVGYSFEQQYQAIRRCWRYGPRTRGRGSPVLF